GVENFTEADEFERVRDRLRALTLTIVGVQNAQPAQLDAAAEVGLASFAANASAQPRGASPAETPPPAPKARLVTEPVRSGTQIYAAGSDVILTATVSPGAEMVADGHIHAY